MKIQKIKLNKIIPADYNPRQITEKEFKKLSKNLEEFGLVDPIVINLKNNHIIGGHQRYHVIKEIYGDDSELDLLQLGDIGWIFFDKKLKIDGNESEKALNLSLNKLSGEWELDKLSKLLSDIELEPIDNVLTGFKPHEFELYSNDEIIFEPQLFNITWDDDEDKIICPNCQCEFYED